MTHVESSPKPEVVPFYSAKQIQLASFLGSPISAAWFFSRNYAAMGSASRRQQSLWAGVVATILLIAASPLLPDKFPPVVLPFAYSLAIYFYAQHCFNRPYEAHIATGGKKGSWWLVVGVSLLAIVFILAVAFGVVLAFPNLLPQT